MRLEEQLRDASITSIHNGYRDGSLKVSDVTGYYLDRIAALNETVNAVISINPEASESAKQQDAELASLPGLPPLFGIPILIKDNIETSELPTTAGSLALKNNLTGRDAPVVTQLRNAGAIILGKANLSEWAFFRSTTGSSGWSAVGGQTRNPHNFEYTPSGSSAGSAAAVAASLCVCSVGTETLGSIISPAAANGVVGIKPGIDLLSQELIVPISHNQDTAGPFGRSVLDTAIMLSCMNDQGKEFHHGLEAASVDGMNLGIIPLTLGYNSEVDTLFDGAVSKLRNAGAEFTHNLIPSVGFALITHFQLASLFEFKHNINLYLSNLPNDLKDLTLTSLIAFNKEHEGKEMQFFGQDIFDAAESKGTLSEPEYVEAQSNLHEPTRVALDRLFVDNNIDAIAGPTMGPAFKIDLENGDGELGGGILTGLAAIAGYPHITVPMGKIDGLPVGFSLVGPRHGEQRLLEIASQLEQLLDYDSSSPV